MIWLQLIFLVIISGIAQYIIAYFKEKGKNLATKYDIGEITNEIKNVESKFTNQTEILKSQLSLLNNVKSEIYSTEKNAIINANEKLYQWLSLVIMRLPTLDDNDDIDRYIKKMDDLYQEEQASEALLELFIDDKSIIDSLHEISGYIYNIHIKKQLILYSLHKQNINSELKESKLNKLGKETNNKFKQLTDQYEYISPLIHKLRLDFKTYINSKCLNIELEA